MQEEPHFVPQPQWTATARVPVAPHYTAEEPVALQSGPSTLSTVSMDDAAGLVTGLTVAPIVVALALYGMGKPFVKRARRVTRDVEMTASAGSEDEPVGEDGECLTILEEEACEVNPSALVQKPAEMSESGKAFLDTLKTAAYFVAWYFFNTAYNIYNKKALNAVDLPWTAATIHLFTGIPYVFFLWFTGLRAAPKLSVDNVKNLSPVCAGHLGTHVGGVIALGAGAVSFMQIVKASEPVVSCILSATLLGQVFPLPVYLTLLPIVGGVGLASLKELSFTWLAFGSAMLSNVSSAFRGIVAKKAMSKPQGENMTESNLYGVLTIMSFCVLLPFSLLVESPAKIAKVWAAANAGGISSGYIAFNLLMSGVCYYLYNETAFLALGRVNAVTHAIANTVKRIVIILASVVIFKTQLTPLGIAGSGIAVFGAFLYAIAKQASGKKKPAA
jgi:solute carrier family 35 protein E1